MKFCRFLTVAFLIFALTACANAPETPDNTPDALATGTQSVTTPTPEVFDVDLTTLSSTMVYAEVYQMMNDPAPYMGKKVRMRGTMAVYEGETRNYYACLIQDATACCSQGIEFVPEREMRYPDDFPKLGTTITVTGVFDTYMEGTERYCQLLHAELKVS